jgi:hypothetical protein
MVQSLYDLCVYVCADLPLSKLQRISPTILDRRRILLLKAVRESKTVYSNVEYISNVSATHVSCDYGEFYAVKRRIKETFDIPRYAYVDELIQFRKPVVISLERTYMWEVQKPQYSNLLMRKLDEYRNMYVLQLRSDPMMILVTLYHVIIEFLWNARTNQIMEVQRRDIDTNAQLTCIEWNDIMKKCKFTSVEYTWTPDVRLISHADILTYFREPPTETDDITVD